MWRHQRVVFAFFILLTAGGISCGGGGSGPQPPATNPVFLTTPPISADENSLYTYRVNATDPSGTAVSYSLVAAPTGTTLVDGELNWVPTPDQARQPNSFTVMATTARGRSAVQSWQITPSGEVHVTCYLRHIWDIGSSSTPCDLSGNDQVRVLVPNSEGGFDQIDGQGYSDGTAVIAHVPAGFYWLVDGGISYLWTDASAVNVSTLNVYADSFSWGRPDLTFVDRYTVNFILSGLSPWQTTDELRWAISNIGYNVKLFSFSPPPLAGATKTTASDLIEVYFDSSKGDQQIFYQLVTHNVAGNEILTLDKASGSIPISGTPSTINATLSDLPQSTFRGNFQASAFDELRPLVNPNAGSGWTDISLKVWSADLFRVTQFAAGSPYLAADLDLGNIAYSNPFNASWPVVLHYETGFEIPYAPPNMVACEYPAMVEASTTSLPTASSALGPVVGAPTNARINGIDFFRDNYNVGTTPIITWDPPDLGMANAGYRARLCYFQKDSFTGKTYPICQFTFYTAATSLLMPPLLGKSTYYFVVLSAMSRSAEGTTTGSAEALSGIISP